MEKTVSDLVKSAENQEIIGEPLLGVVPRIDRFHIEIDSLSFFYTAAAYRPLIKGIQITNLSWVGDAEEMVVTVQTEAVGTTSLIHPVARAYPIPAIKDIPINFDVLKLRPRLHELAALDESVVGNVVVQIHIDDQLVAEQRKKVEFLAYNQWLHSPLDYETLSAFVLPNHPVVAKIMEGVRERMNQLSGSSATAGYQLYSQSQHSGLQHVTQIMQSIFEELHALGLSYTNPPASFEGFGQKIRTPDVILSEKAATCLDSTVLTASCIAAAGLSPLLFLVRGHAFPGVWLVPAIAPTGVVSNPNDWQDLVSKGVIGSFESTNICNPRETYETSKDRHEDYSAGDNVNDFEAFIDVERASQLGVRRLPNRNRGTQIGEVEIIVDSSDIESIHPTNFETNVHIHASTEDREKLNDGNIPMRVRRWMDALLDISNLNPLINLISTPAFISENGTRAKKSIQLPMVPGLLAEVENALFHSGSIKAVCTHRIPGHLLNNFENSKIVEYFKTEGTLAIGPITDSMTFIERIYEMLIDNQIPPGMARLEATNLFENRHEIEVAKRFRSLKKLADDTEASSATNQLFMTIGSLVWESPGEGGRGARQVKSPMFVLPVRLSGTASTSFTIRLDDGAEISPNYCLLEKLKTELGLTISELENPNLDEFGIDVTDTISRIRRQLSDSKFSSIRIEEDCQLAVLDFATFRMWKDLKTNWPLFSRNVVVDHLINGSNASLQEDHPTFEGEILTPFDCDESQVEAVRWAIEGRSFVLEGPPGTGKSQTIANLIAASMAEGKRVLFVAEKQVALDGVAEKLEEIGLDPFCITMHHESTTPDTIRKQLKTSLDFVGEDTNSRWNSETAVANSLRSRLSQYRDQLIEQNSVGENAISAHQTVVRLGDGPVLDIPLSSLESVGRNLAAIRSSLLEIRSVVGASRVTPDDTWSISALEDPEAVSKGRLWELIEDTDNAMKKILHLSALIAPLLEDGGRLSEDVRRAIRTVAEGKGLPADIARQIVDTAWTASVQLVSHQISSHMQSNREIFDFFKPEAFAIDLSLQMSAAKEAMEAGLLSRKKKYQQLLSLISPIANDVITKEPAEILIYLQRIAPARDGVESVKDLYRGLKYLDHRADFDPMNTIHIKELEESAHDLVGRAEAMLAPGVEVIHELVLKGIGFSASDIDSIDQFLDSWNLLQDFLKVDTRSKGAWRGSNTEWTCLEQSLMRWKVDSPQFSLLMQASRLNRTLSPLRSAGLQNVADAILDGSQSLDDIFNEFERGLAKAALNERLAQDGLTNFDRDTFDRTVADFTRRDRIRKDLMQLRIPFELAASRPFKAGVRTGEIGNLEKELVKKVRRVSVPQLIRSYGETITRLTPCFLMSPEAVSRLLPADKQFFDIVVFDEASQIRVAAAIPAMGRGKSVVIVGDSQQMPPSRKIGQKSSQAESDTGSDEDGNVLDLESILTECTEAHLPSLMLKCHFRSQHEGLIAFSNRNFYDNNLTTFPAPNVDKSTPVHWFDVPDGQFERTGDAKGTNPAEVRAVVNEIQRRLNDPEHTGKSIGVVTFNDRQAAAILDKLTELAASDKAVLAALNAPQKKKLFVQPLEKVQGDERDTIILSVSYSYQGGDRTKVSPTWGPITNKGGERRLNVAITRAKKELLVFCSFDPNHVNKDSSTHLGVPYTVEFLKECRDIGLSGGAAFRSRESISRDFRRQKLFELLRNNGIQVRENVGLSRFRIDLAISDSAGNQFLALLLDGDEWANRSTPFDREVLPNTVMKTIGWRRVGRVWLKSVVDNPNYVLETVKNELKREELRLALVELIKNEGYEVRSDTSLSRVGIDLAIRKDNSSNWPLAITLNCAGVFQQFVSYEGEIPPESVLKSVNCVEAIGIWLPDFENSESTTLESINLAFSKAMSNMEILSDVPAQPIQTVKEKLDAEAANGEEEAIQLRASEYWSEFKDGRALPLIGAQSILGPGVGYNPAIVRRAIDEVVLLEGPILETRLASVVASRFGMKKVTASRLYTFQKAFSHLKRTEGKFGTVYWSDDRPADTWSGFRTSIGEPVRAIGEVPAEEIANAMIAVVRLGGSAYEEQVIRLVAKAYGRKAVTAVLAEELNAILQWTISSGKITNDSGLLKLP